MMIIGAGFDQGNADVRVLGKTVSEDASGCTGTYDNIVKLIQIVLPGARWLCLVSDRLDKIYLT